jgi:hypothetical protein
MFSENNTREMVRRTTEALDYLKNASDFIYTMSDYEADSYRALGMECELAKKQIPALIEDGDFMDEASRANTVNLLRRGANLVRGNDFPFLGQHIDALIVRLGAKRVQ